MAPVTLQKTRHHGTYRSSTARDSFQEASLQSTSPTAENDAQATKTSVSVRYKKGKELYVADTLSRPPVADYPSAANAKQEYEVFQVEITEMDIEQNRVTSETMQRIKEETAKDPVLAALCDVVATGWLRKGRKRRNI